MQFLLSVRTMNLLKAEKMALELGYDGLEVRLPSRRAHQLGQPLGDDINHLTTVQVVHAAAGVYDESLFGECLTEALTLAKRLQAGLVNIHPPSLKYTDEASRGRMYARLHELSQEFGIAVSVEVLQRPNKKRKHQLEEQSHNNPQHWIQDMIARGMLATVDTTHLGSWEADIIECMRALGPQLRHVHMSDYNIHTRKQHRTLGEGHLPLAEVLQALNVYHPDITVTFEPSGSYEDDGTLPQTAEQSIKFIRKALSL